MKWLDPIPTQPLGLPRGSVRAILALLLVIFTGAAVLATLATGNSVPAGIGILATLTTSVVQSYFGDRRQEQLERRIGVLQESVEAGAGGAAGNKVSK